MEKLFCKTGITISLRCLLIVASLVFGSSAWGQTEITWNSDKDWTGIGTTNISYTSGDYTISASKASNPSTNPTVSTKSNDFRTYAKNTFTVTSSNDNITRIVFFISSNGQNRWTDVAPNTGTTTVDKTASTTSWEGDAKAITFTVGEKATYGTDGISKPGQFCIDKLVIYTSGGKTAATVTFAQESYTVETNGIIKVSATTNSTSPIVYSISPADGNVSINEINENTSEIVAGKNPDTYTITATVAENENFTSASATCPLTVTAPSFNIAAPTYYKKITSTDELAVGGTYLIVCEGAKKALSATVSTLDYTQGENNTVTNETAATLGEFELVKTNENYNNAPLYELKLNGQCLNGAKTGTGITLTSSSETTKWIIKFNNGNVEIDSYSTFSTSESDRGLVYQTQSQAIKHYAVSNRNTSGYLKVQLYQKVTDLSISTLTNGYATFVTDVPYVMPKGACGYAVTVAQQVGVITKKEAYTEGAQVPARTALLIGGTSGTNYYPAVLKEDVAPSYSGANYMEGKRNAEGKTDSQRGVAVYYYKLALNSASKPGFYYGAADGAAFKLTKPTTAYLAVPKSGSPVNGYLIDFEGEETGIDSIAPSNGNADGAVYNLNGIRMAQPLRSLPKGVYIVNGKKVIRF